MKAVIVGCGCIAAIHAAVLNQLDNVELAGVADIIDSRAEAYAETYHSVPYHSLEEMLEAVKPDVLHICVPHYLHVPMAIYALQHGVNVFMEKPPAISFEQLKELKTAVSSSEARLGLCFQNRYNPCVQAAREMLASGKAGKILGARGLVTWYRSKPYYTESGWRGKLATEGGGALINQSVHTLDLLLYLLGKPEWIDASMSNHHLKGIIEVEDTMEAMIRFEQDRTAAFFATTAYCTNEPPLIEVACENMKIRIEDPDVTFLYPDGTSEKPHLTPLKRLGKDYWGSGHIKCISEYYKSLEENRPFALDLPTMEPTIRLMLAAYQSARENHPVYL